MCNRERLKGRRWGGTSLLFATTHNVDYYANRDGQLSSLGQFLTKKIGLRKKYRMRYEANSKGLGSLEGIVVVAAYIKERSFL